MKCTCGTASREARNAALEEAAEIIDAAEAYYSKSVIGLCMNGAATSIRALKTARPSDIVKAGALREATDALYRTISALNARIAELEDHLSQANDTIARMSRCAVTASSIAERDTDRLDRLTRCQTAADLQREREAEKAAWLKAYGPGVEAPDIEGPAEARSATERPPTAPDAVWDDSSLSDEQLRVAIERRRAPAAEDGFEAHPWPGKDGGIDA
jgi:uncharacterized coiled-coil protein SlyX